MWGVRSAWCGAAQATDSEYVSYAAAGEGAGEPRPAANLRPHQTSRLQTPDVSAERIRDQAAAEHWLMTNFRSCPTIIIQIADN